MVQRSYYKVLIVVAFALGVVLTVMCLTLGSFSFTGPMGDSREPSADNNVFQNDGREAIAVATAHQALEPLSSGTALDRGSAREAKPSVQPLDEDALLEETAHKGNQGGKETERASRATRPIAQPKLVAGNTTVEETERGPVASFQFRPTTTDPLGPVIVVAFLPPSSDAKILDLSPTRGTAYSKIDKRISENGWFAAFQGTPQDMTDLSFHLSVSKPVVATIKGNCGIEPFEIDLRPSR